MSVLIVIKTKIRMVDNKYPLDSGISPYQDDRPYQIPAQQLEG